MKKVITRSGHRTKRIVAKCFIGLGLALNILGWLIIILNIRPITFYVFLLFWYGYIMLVDGLNYTLKKHSLIINQPKHFLLSLPLSLIFWGIYEVYNYFIFHGWQYLMPPTPGWIKFAFTPLAWATVIPGIVETGELLESLYGRLSRRKSSVEPRSAPLTKKSRVVPITLMVAGSLLLILPWAGVYPYVEKLPHSLVWLLSFFFWGALAILLDPILYLTGKPSLIGGLERGRFQKLIILFVTGYVCGFFWELWNYWAGAKWVYTATWLQGDPIKIFEMPLRGFFGFGPFAISVYVLWNFPQLIFKKKIQEVKNLDF